ncbi:MAG: tRNA (adenosine(37)-N6)-threonylcarbamoyltransferase complex dimerization subunit type 1 TsaB [Anaerolineaceae bacterium]
MLLAVDCSTRWVGLAIYDGAQVLSEMVWQSQNHHTVEISPALETLFRHSGVQRTDLTALGVALGPGSFTSLRIGLALAKGMSLALHIPIIGIPTLDIVVAAQPFQDLPLAAVLHAGRGRLAVGWYNPGSGRWQADGDAQVMVVDDLSQRIHKPTVVCGELTAEERQILARKRRNVLLASPALSLRRPSYLAELAWRRWQSGETDDPVSLAPVYLHVADPIPE